jgi:hypothetical protein
MFRLKSLFIVMSSYQATLAKGQKATSKAVESGIRVPQEEKTLPLIHADDTD